MCVKYIIPKIIISRHGFSFTALNGDGSLDTGFGDNGTVTTQLGDFPQLSALISQPDNKIIAVGSASSGSTTLRTHFAVARYNGDGTPDLTFGTNGTTLNAFASSGGAARAVALQPDGKIIVGGVASTPLGQPLFALMRHNTNGSLDTDFGNNGTATVFIESNNEIGRHNGVSALSVQTSGKIVAVGGRFIARFKHNGSLDARLGNNGTMALGGRFDEFSAVLPQPDDEILLAGRRANPIAGVLFTDVSCGNSDFLLARYNVVVEIIGDEDIEDGGPPPPDVVKKYAPLVLLHSQEKYGPADASTYIQASELRWSHQTLAKPGVDFPCGDHSVAARGTIIESRLGNPFHQNGGAIGTPPYAHSPRSSSLGDLCHHIENLELSTHDYTRPFDGAKRPGLFALEPAAYLREGFFLDPENSDALRQGNPNLSLSQEDEYEGAPVYYDYVPGHYVTYWFFYAYNSFDTRFLGVGAPNQSHEGDWEQISILLNCDDQPVKVAYYGHGNATLYDWPRDGALTGMRLAGANHPQVFAAIGSHGSYAQPGPHPGLALGQTDQTEFGRAWKTWRRLVNLKSQAWYGYGGAWGELGGVPGEFDDTVFGGEFTGPLGPSIFKDAYPAEWNNLFCTVEVMDEIPSGDPLPSYEQPPR